MTELTLNFCEELEDGDCCMCNEKGNFPTLKELKKKNIYQLNKLKSQEQVELLLKLGFKETDKFCFDCFWK